jgi:hypothetical protein
VAQSVSRGLGSITPPSQPLEELQKFLVGAELNHGDIITLKDGCAYFNRAIDASRKIQSYHALPKLPCPNPRSSALFTR